MDITILDSWLREHLSTDAEPKDIARCLSLCGPSIEKVETVSFGSTKDSVYHIEVTTNRVDAMSVRGIALEASVILPEFGYAAKLTGITTSNGEKSIKETLPLKMIVNPSLTYRLMAVSLEVPQIGDSPEVVKNRLEASGIRSLNAVVDITNYVMTEIGHPTHVFDFDKVTPTMRIRPSVKGERIVSFDGKSYDLPGGDIVIDNGQGEIIDLPGIIGTQNSVVNEKTKRILFFIDTNNPANIRKTSMTLGIRTVAATLNEKGVDPHLSELALKRGLYLYQEMLGAKQISPIYDIFPKPPKANGVGVTHKFIEDFLGVAIPETRVTNILTKLGMQVTKKAKNYVVTPPTHRLRDIVIREDVVEEVARIYGYHNLPSHLMTGALPEEPQNSAFRFEDKLRNILKSQGASEVYTLSLVSETAVKGSRALRIANPLGGDSAYLRTSLMPSLIEAAKSNLGETNQFHLFEIANIYLPKKGDLPEEQLILAGIFYKFNYRTAKGVIENIIAELHINYQVKTADAKGFLPSQCIDVSVGGEVIGTFGVLEIDQLIYYEFAVAKLRVHKSDFPAFKAIPKYPAQVEDITLVLPEKTIVADLIATLKNTDKIISEVSLTDIFENAFTFKVVYQSDDKTLENAEVEKVRALYLKKLAQKFGAIQK